MHGVNTQSNITTALSTKVGEKTLYSLFKGGIDQLTKNIQKLESRGMGAEASLIVNKTLEKVQEQLPRLRELAAKGDKLSKSEKAELAQIGKSISAILDTVNSGIEDILKKKDDEDDNGGAGGGFGATLVNPPLSSGQTIKAY